MQIYGVPKIALNQDVKNLIDLYSQLGERAENFLPNRIFESLKNFVRLCYEEPDDPNKQQAEIHKYVLELKEAIPGYVDVFLMMFPHEDSKAFEYSAKRKSFFTKLDDLIDNELVDESAKDQINNINNSHDFSIGTPPVTHHTIGFLFKILLGDKVRELRKFRDLIGISGDIEEAQWNYMLDVFDQMINQSTHYTTLAEKQNFLSRTESTVNFKGMNGFIRTIVSGNANTAIELLANEIFGPEVVREIEFTTPDELYEQIENDNTSIFAVKIPNMRKNPFNTFKWFPFLSRIVFIDNSPESQATNTSLIFCFHNGIINTLNKVHTKKLGALANSQLNLRLILEKVNPENLRKFRQAIEMKINSYKEELKDLKQDQLAEPENPDQDITLFKYDEFSRQVIKDKYILSKFGAYLSLIESVREKDKQLEINKDLIKEFEARTKSYFYSENKKLHLAAVYEGGGRNQIRTYADYLLQRPLKPVNKEIVEKCRTLLDIIPNTYQRTLNNHFHKNFGINIFLEKYKEYLVKAENDADNYGRFMNLLIDLGIEKKYSSKTEEEQKMIKEFISALGNLEKTSISDDVQMIIRDILFSSSRKRNPYIFFNQEASWEYKDLFPADRYDLNPFDIEVELDYEGRIDWERLQKKLERIKSTFQLFDETGNLWDRFCENSTIIINDPSNPSGFTDFNNLYLIKFLKFLSNSKLTLFLDEAYNDAVKVEDPEEPKWRTISRYIMNNITSYSKISVVSSLSTTKNLGATGDRMGSLAATPARKDVIDFTRKRFTLDKGNTNSVFMLVNILEIAQLAKRIKDRMEENLPKDASRHKIKENLKEYIIEEIKHNFSERNNGFKGKTRRPSMFEGSPLHIFLLEELTSLDKLDVLELADDFKYKGEPFFSYYKKYLVYELNRFRINKIFRTESKKRLEIAKTTASVCLQKVDNKSIGILKSDGSFLFNLHLHDFFSYQDLEKFSKKLAEYRGLALIPYQTGFIRFSLGGYLFGDEKSYQDFEKEFENALNIFIKYWDIFYKKKKNPENKTKRTEDILDGIFKIKSDQEFIELILNDFDIISTLHKKQNKSLRINDIKTLYHAFPKDCGITINSIGDSKNAVLEFYENIGQCRNLLEFVNSKAFTKVYENLLPQIYKKIPQIKGLDINQVISKFGKPTLLKYIKSKLEFQPTSHILDDPNELNTMREILVELENILFSDAKVKIIALQANECDIQGDLARLEGYNTILKKYIQEILLHFNLPFELEYQFPTIEELMATATNKFTEITGIEIDEIDFTSNLNNFISELRSSMLREDDSMSKMAFGLISKLLADELIQSSSPLKEKLLYFYLIQNKGTFKNKIKEKLSHFDSPISNLKDLEMKLISEDYYSSILPGTIKEILKEVINTKNFRISENDIHDNVRQIVLFISKLMNATKNNEYYDRYNHVLIKIIETEFKKQKSSTNEMIQHGIVLHKDFKMKNKVLEKWDDGSLEWINNLMSRCGVIALEKAIQTHTRIVTDAKKRDSVARNQDFHEIYEVFKPTKAGEQSDRCIQCGDPYCHNGCPLHNLIPQWLKATAGHDLEFAFNLSNETSPFPEVMGRVCPHDKLCEGACTLNHGYGAITIGSVETFITEEGFKKGLKPKFSAQKIGKKVAIIGAGPAGLSAATFLLREGVDVEIFDKQERAGGLLTYGIPGFKLDKNIISRRVKFLLQASAVFHQNIEIGKDKNFEDLRENFDAVFIGVGAVKGRKSGLIGEDAENVHLAMDFLVDVQKKLFNEERAKYIEVKDKNVVVVGGGDTAMDCVRTSLREGAQSVKCLYRRDAQNMPGSTKEYINAKEEGVNFEFYVSPKSLISNEHGDIVAVEMIKTKLGDPDASGRQSVEEISGSEYRVAADVIIFALGFDTVNYPFYASNGIETDKRGGIVIDQNYQTTKPGVYAGGDCHRGASLVVTAVLEGRDAAKAMVKSFIE